MKTKRLKEGEYLIYNGIIAFIDEPNDDLPTSNNIQFYRYIKGHNDLYSYNFDDKIDYTGLLATEDNIKEYIRRMLLNEEVYHIVYTSPLYNQKEETFTQEELFTHLVEKINGLLETIESYEYREYGDSGCKKYIEKIEKF